MHKEIFSDSKKKKMKKKKKHFYDMNSEKQKKKSKQTKKPKQKNFFPKFQLIESFCLQVMLDYVDFSLLYRILCLISSCVW